MSQSISSKNLVQPEVHSSKTQPELYQKIATSLGCHQGFDVQVIQRLWGGYGELVRLVFAKDNSGSMNNASVNSVIVKYAALPNKLNTPKAGTLNYLINERCTLTKWKRLGINRSLSSGMSVVLYLLGCNGELQENEWLIACYPADIGFPLTSQFDVLAVCDELATKETQLEPVLGLHCRRG